MKNLLLLFSLIALLLSCEKDNEDITPVNDQTNQISEPVITYRGLLIENTDHTYTLKIQGDKIISFKNVRQSDNLLVDSAKNIKQNENGEIIFKGELRPEIKYEVFIKENKNTLGIKFIHPKGGVANNSATLKRIN